MKPQTKYWIHRIINGIPLTIIYTICVVLMIVSSIISLPFEWISKFCETIARQVLNVISKNRYTLLDKYNLRWIVDMKTCKSKLQTK